MPVTFPSGLVVYNVTPHDLHFMVSEGEVVRVPSDGVVNAQSFNHEVERGRGFILATVEYRETEEGRSLVDKIRRQDPDALIVGSIVAAQAYPGEVVSPRPYRSSRFDKSNRIMQYNRFTVFEPKENN